MLFKIDEQPYPGLGYHYSLRATESPKFYGRVSLGYLKALSSPSAVLAGVQAILALLV